MSNDMGRFSNNPSFNRYASLLGELHELMSSGRSESDEAEGVRDAMDLPWRNLDRAECSLLDGLSGDLYSIGGERDAPVERPNEVDVQRYTEAMERHDWSSALDIIRQSEHRFQAAEVAYLRGICWAQLHQPRIALYFLDEAYRLGRRDVFQDVVSMTCEVIIGVGADAARRASALAQDSHNPLVVLTAATALLDYAMRTEFDLRAERIAEALAMFRTGLALANNEPTDPIERALLGEKVLNAHVHMAIGFDAVDQLESARSSCIAALDLDPTNEHALTLLGWLDRRLNSNSRQAERPDAFRMKQHRSAIMDSGQVLSSFTPQPSLG